MYFAPIASLPIAHTTAPLTQSFERFAFGSYGLYNSRAKVLKINNDDIGKVELNTFAYPLSDGEGILSKYYRGRTLTLRVVLKGDSEDDLSHLIDEFKKNMRYTNEIFSMLIAGERRGIRGTVVSMAFNREYYHTTWINADVTLQVVDPFWSGEIIYTLFETRTGQFFEEMTNTGSTESTPQIYVVVGSGTTSSVSIKISDREIVVSEPLTSGDILHIDSQEKQVMTNGVGVDYSGLFPALWVGSNLIDIDIGGVTADISIVSPKNYL